MDITARAARRNRNVTIRVTQGTARIGLVHERDGDFSHLAEVLQEVLPGVAWHDTIRTELWRRLAANCITNPLIALWDCPNGELHHHPGKIALICEGVVAVIEREGHHISMGDLRYYIEQVVDSTVESISPMLQDIRALRHTEIDYTTGYLLKYTRVHGIAVPENAYLSGMVKRKESEYKRSNTGMSRPWQ